MRTPNEIEKRIEQIRKEDIFGFGALVLVFKLPYSMAKKHLSDEVGEEEYGQTLQERNDYNSVEKEAREYMDFAIGKALDHRGLSAGRSITKMKEWMWLLEKDHKIDWNKYENYGVPILKQICKEMNWPWPENSKALENMANGEPCIRNCDMGCGT